MSNDISDTFGMNPMPEIPKRSSLMIIDNQTNNQQAEQDIDQARANIYNMLDTGVAAIEELSNIAKSSQHPRAFEVLNSMLKTVSDMSETLIKLHETKKKILADTPDNQDESKNVTNNILYVGSTTELQKFIENKNKS